MVAPEHNVAQGAFAEQANEQEQKDEREHEQERDRNHQYLRHAFGLVERLPRAATEQHGRSNPRPESASNDEQDYRAVGEPLGCEGDEQWCSFEKVPKPGLREEDLGAGDRGHQRYAVDRATQRAEEGPVAEHGADRGPKQSTGHDAEAQNANEKAGPASCAQSHHGACRETLTSVGWHSSMSVISFQTQLRPARCRVTCRTCNSP